MVQCLNVTQLIQIEISLRIHTETSDVFEKKSKYFDEYRYREKGSLCMNGYQGERGILNSDQLIGIVRVN